MKVDSIELLFFLYIYHEYLNNEQFCAINYP